MLDLLGSGYVIDHCIAAFVKEKQEELYQIYVTDALRALNRNAAFKDGDIVMTARMYDILHPEAVEPEITPEEGRENILKKFREGD